MEVEKTAEQVKVLDESNGVDAKEEPAKLHPLAEEYV